MIYLDASVLPDPEKPEALRAALQLAISIELATVPVYLYAHYSLKPGDNDLIADRIHSVVVEEMLHVMLDCNLLNAIGGEPKLNAPARVPRYPGPFPGGVDPGPTLSLERFSLDLLNRVFLPIEAPEDPPPVTANGSTTVGQFYRAIRAGLEKGGSALFIGDPQRQIAKGIKGVMAVTDTKTALEAIDVIVHQGEGTPGNPVGTDDELAHYYRFMEIAKGKKYVPDPKNPAAWCYCGDPIPFNRHQVFAVPTNPKAAHYKLGSPARHACDAFNKTYSNLLNALNATVNAQQDRFKDAFGLMFSLRKQALEMMSGEKTKGQPIGPSFEYQAENW